VGKWGVAGGASVVGEGERMEQRGVEVRKKRREGATKERTER